MIDEAQVRNIARKFLDEEHLLGFIKIFEKEHNLFRGSHDKIQLPAALNVPQQIVDHISGKIRFEDLEDVSIPTKTTGDFVQYDGATELWTRQAALAEGSIVIAVADGYFSEDNTNFTWDNTSKIFKVIGNTFLDGAVVINDANADKDFRVEGSGATYTHLLFTDAGSNMVGINEDAPKALLHVRLSTCADYAGLHPNSALLLEGSGNISLQLQAATTGTAYIAFTDDDYNPPAGRIAYSFPDSEMNFAMGGSVLVFFRTTGARFAQNELEIDSTAAAYFTANAHNADAYFALEEDEAIKWSMGFDYNDSLKFQISAGVPGTNVCIEIDPAGAGLINLYLDVGIRDNQDLRLYDNGNYVGFKSPALAADQIWTLPNADADAANKCLQSDASGNLGWSQALGTADSVSFGTIGCGTITVANGSSINLQEDITFTGATTENLIKFPDNLAVALAFKEGTETYILFNTTNGSEKVEFGEKFTGITGSSIGNLIFANGSITDSGGAISFGDENLSTTGTFDCGNLTVSGSSPIVRIENTDAAAVDAASIIHLVSETTVQARVTGQIYGAFSDTTDATRHSYIRFATAAAGAFGDSMTILGRNVGIGTVTPGERLTIKSSAAPSDIFKIIRSSDANSIFKIRETGGGSGILYLSEGGTDKVVLQTGGDSYFLGGNVGIGTAAPAVNLHLNRDSAGFVRIRTECDSKTATNEIMHFSHRALDSNDNVTAYTNIVSSIVVSTDGAETGMLHFEEIDSSHGGVGFAMVGDKIKFPSIASTDAGDYDLRYDAADGVVYDTSDARQKSNVIVLDYGLSEILQLQPRSYDYHVGSSRLGKDEKTGKFKKEKIKIATESAKSFGLIAQEVFDVIPEAVYKPKDETIAFWGIREKKLIPILINAIQELNEKIEGLEEFDEELKAKIAEYQPRVDAFLDMFGV